MHTCQAVLQELSDYRLTLRQLYYQLVSRNLLPNTEQAYSRLSRTMTRARLAGLVGWGAIEDRIRVPDSPPEFADLAELVRAALHTYRLPRWQGQKEYVELWVEKDALASVLRPIARQFHVTLMVNRGYSSASAMYDAAQRFWDAEEYNRRCTLLYLGDLDPSGEDMVRDIGDRLYELDATVQVQKLALTIEQVEQYQPPPNPAKLTDSRAPDFIARYGASSWEVDALAPPVLTEIITSALAGLCDEAAMAEVMDKEERDKAQLTAAVQEIMDKED